ncbi:MAG: helix-turn-helix domain-containing protein [Wujia sp.]
MQNQTFYKQLGKRIQVERERVGMSRERLADRAEISSKFLYEIENGKKGFACETFYKICKVLYVDPTYMLDGSNRLTDKSKIEYMIRDFDKKEMRYLIKLIEQVCILRNYSNGK